jgi:hypothetical protein
MLSSYNSDMEHIVIAFRMLMLLQSILLWLTHSDNMVCSSDGKGM